ncbi:hypothetical protein F396_gp32 [Pectobacterium phage ZF40]|nr:hypothetical protein F396_gp32 [Pectobacterium phage ZF40]AFC22484.1 hypothetical protein ZF40_0032 [Pectobacterium phage ZF40]
MFAIANKQGISYFLIAKAAFVAFLFPVNHTAPRQRRR